MSLLCFLNNIHKKKHNKLTLLSTKKSGYIIKNKSAKKIVHQSTQDTYNGHQKPQPNKKEHKKLLHQINDHFTKCGALDIMPHIPEKISLNLL